MSKFEFEYISKVDDIKTYINKIEEAFSKNKIPFLVLNNENGIENWLFLLQKPIEIQVKKLLDPNLEEEGVEHDIVILQYPQRHIRINLTTEFVRVYIDDDTIDEWDEGEIQSKGDVLNTIEKLIEEYKKAYKIFFVFYPLNFDIIYLECDRRTFKFHLS